MSKSKTLIRINPEAFALACVSTCAPAATVKSKVLKYAKAYTLATEVNDKSLEEIIELTRKVPD